MNPSLRLKNARIAVFDSGIGGLAVVREIMKLLPEEEIIYLGDTARVPCQRSSKKIYSTNKDISGRTHKECSSYKPRFLRRVLAFRGFI